MNEKSKKEKPNYYAVIPADVRYCKKISKGAKLLYGEITALCSKKGFCWASNEYFADLYGVKKGTASVWIRVLSKNKFISYEIKDGYRRKIFLMGHMKNRMGAYEKSYGGHMKNRMGAYEKSYGGHTKNRMGAYEKSSHNNTVNNTTNNKIEIEDIYNHFKNKINKRSRLLDKSKNKIKTRLKTYTVEELKRAIDNFSDNTWNMKNNSHRGVAWFFHSDERIDGYLNLKNEEKPKVWDCNN